jgi:hypothetical protein
VWLNFNRGKEENIFLYLKEEKAEADLSPLSKVQFSGVFPLLIKRAKPPLSK